MSTSLKFKKICDDFGLTKFGVRHALEQYQVIIIELTNGFFSKLTYDAPVILDKVRECFEEKYSDMEPVRHGRWVKMTGMMPPEYHGHYECSECQWHMKGIRNSWTREEEMSYCPNCGAKMDGDENYACETVLT